MTDGSGRLEGSGDEWAQEGVRVCMYVCLHACVCVCCVCVCPESQNSMARSMCSGRNNQAMNGFKNIHYKIKFPFEVISHREILQGFAHKSNLERLQCNYKEENSSVKNDG